MAAKQEKTTYLFLASRLYPYSKEGEKVATTNEDGTREIQRKKGQQIVALDVTTRFSNEWQGNVTSYPVSTGSDITDHITIRNNKYTLEGIVSDIPFEVHKQEELGQLGTGAERTHAALQLLDEMFRSKVIFTLYSEYQQIDNCVITSINFDQTPEFAIRFTIQMEQIRLAYAKTVSLKVSAGTKKKVASNQNGGGTTKATADTDQYRKNRDASILKNNTP